ncbi:unnamed protein product [Adineta ricciae]|uniref:Thioredoxin domain-containing protein n=1 Tax=Adineta ricciae TaxID=249248 RepID=A0A815C5H4_ADIRI|nr:unnamed protein product [Adineta ricciae]CAF1439080.1 unnamed protein product [Adineta ricciae]
MAGLAKTFNGRVLNKSKEKINLTDRKYQGKIFGLYFGASWCQPCRAFSSFLSEIYDEFHKEKRFQIIYVSADADEQSYNQYCQTMPWLAVDFRDHKLRDDLAMKYSVTDVPKLVLIDGDTGKTLCTNAKEQILYLDTEGVNFPWKSS